jgi:hypothetical protein
MTEDSFDAQFEIATPETTAFETTVFETATFETATRQRIFELFDEAARLADRIDDRALSSLALAGTMIAGPPQPARRGRKRKPALAGVAGDDGARGAKILSVFDFKARTKRAPR